jgi:hypothetical protein
MLKLVHWSASSIMSWKGVPYWEVNISRDHWHA